MGGSCRFCKTRGQRYKAQVPRADDFYDAVRENTPQTQALQTRQVAVAARTLSAGVSAVGNAQKFRRKPCGLDVESSAEALADLDWVHTSCRVSGRRWRCGHRVCDADCSPSLYSLRLLRLLVVVEAWPASCQHRTAHARRVATSRYLPQARDS